MEAQYNYCEMQEICLFSKVSTLNLGLTQSPIQWLPWALSLRMVQPRLKGDHTPHIVSRLKMRRGNTSTPHTSLHICTEATIPLLFCSSAYHSDIQTNMYILCDMNYRSMFYTVLKTVNITNRYKTVLCSCTIHL